ncbi:hypothetical protein LCGC14_2914790 [marine sediment metagenome]|uniref:Uncharacterized protein n=1 Tax=marine sediment metagenome TaxID=412755 RepID=A0A0F9AGS5_9ZZZZ
MLEALYDKSTKEVLGWCADSKQFGNFTAKKGQAIVILDCDIPTVESDVYRVDLVAQTILDNPDYVPIKPRNLEAEIDELRAEIGELRK